MNTDMSTPQDPRLDDFERRLHELERELAELRLAMSVAAPPVEAGLPSAPAIEPSAGLAPGYVRHQLSELERLRVRSLQARDADGLLEVAELARELEGRAPEELRSDARRLAAVAAMNAEALAEPAHEAEAQPAAVYDQSDPAQPVWSLPSFSLPELSAAKTLAIAGGVVTLLGIVFFFVLAVNRGWIGPGGRVALGAVAAAVVFAGGLELRRRYGETHSSLAAVAVGIAGGYAVLLAAAALYHFVGHPVALVIAAAIAAVGTFTALRWESQIVAALGLLGATLAPLAVAAQGGLTVLGIAFVAFMTVATAIVALRQRWNVLLVLGAYAGLGQALGLVMQAKYAGVAPADVVALAAVFSAIAVGVGIAVQLRDASRDLGQLPTGFLFAGAVFAAGSAARLYGSPESKGVALLVVAISLAATAAVLFPRQRDRDLSALLGALGLIVGGIAFGELMSGSPLAFAWAGEAAVLAWLARRVKEIRYQLFAIVYLVAAAVHALAIDVTPNHLFKPLESSAGGALAAVATGAAAAVIAFHASRRAKFGPRRGLFGLLAPLYQGLAARQLLLRAAGYWLSGLAAVYALSLGILAAVPDFGWGHAVMYAVWSAIGIGVYTTGLLRRVGQVRVGGYLWLGATVIAAIANGEHALTADPRAAACLVAGVAFLAVVLVELFLVLAPVYEDLEEDERALRLLGCWAGGVGSVAALSVGVLAAVPSFGWGQVAMYGLWSALGLGVLIAALRREAGQIRIGALVGLGVTLVVAFVNGERSIAPDPRAAVFFVVGTALLAAALADQLLPRRRGLSPVVLGLVLGSVGIGLAAFVVLLGGNVGVVDERGLGFLGLAALYAVLAGAVFRLEGQRDVSTLFCSTALVLGYGSSERLVPGMYHVLALSIASVALAWLATRAREPRFLVAAGATLLVGIATVVFSVVPPSHLFLAQTHPGHAALATLFVALAAAAVAHIVGDGGELRRRSRSFGWWSAGVLAVYGLSVFILALFQASFAASVDTNFHRGHTAVSAFWGLIGLALLYFGLTRLRALRVAGFAMFTVSLAKIFLFDLPSLSSITRALSFLAVGGVLLLGGFFYQRLATAQPAPPKRRHEAVQWPRRSIRPELAVALAAVVVLIVWFGSGIRPLGRSSDQAGAAVAVPASATPTPTRAHAVKTAASGGALDRRAAKHCGVHANAAGGTVRVLVDSCSRTVRAVSVFYPRYPSALRPYYLAGNRVERTYCSTRGRMFRCKIDPALSRGTRLVVETAEGPTGSSLKVVLTDGDGHRSAKVVHVD